MLAAFFTTANKVVKIFILLSLGIEIRNQDSRGVRHVIRLLCEQLTTDYLVKNSYASGETQDAISCFTTVDTVPPTRVLSLQDKSAIILPSDCKMFSEMATPAHSF
jgi:hypothetical protein